MAEWFKALDWRCEGRWFEFRHGTNIIWQDIILHLLLSTQVLNGYRYDATVIVGQTVFERQVTPGWNAPQGVDIVHTVCAGKH